MLRSVQRSGRFGCLVRMSHSEPRICTSTSFQRREKSSISPDSTEKEKGWRIVTELSQHIWPDSSKNPNAGRIKARVMTAISLLAGAKLINIQVPFVFKSLVDMLLDLVQMIMALLIDTKVLEC